MLHLQLTVLHVGPRFERLKEQVRSIVGMLEDNQYSDGPGADAVPYSLRRGYW
jgi:hypothetical protein